MIWYQLSNVFVTGYTGETRITAIKEDNIELEKKSAVVDLVAGSFFHDLINQRVYLWPSGSDNPNSNSKIYMLYVWLGFCDTRADYAIQGEDSIFYRPVIDNAQAPPFSQSITDLFSGIVTNSFGNLVLIDPVWFYENRENYVWINSDAAVKYGPLDGDYGDYKEIAYGIIKSISISDSGANFSFIDIRDRLFTTIPPDRFTKGAFPYLQENILYNARAVLVGKKRGITPNLVDTVSFVYEVSQVQFDFHDFPGIESIDAVYKDGVPLVDSVDYATDLPNGQFKLLSSPGDSIVSCDAEGLKISRNFATGTWLDTYSFNIADITFFYLQLQGIESRYIDETGFEKLQLEKSGVPCGDWLSKEIEFKEKLPELQTPGLFHLVPRASGKLYLIPYSFTDEPQIFLTNEWYNGFTYGRDSAGIISRVLVRHSRAPVVNVTETEGGEGLAEYEFFEKFDKSSAFIYQATRMKQFRTIAADRGTASGIANKLMALHNQPPETVSFQTNHDAMEWEVLDKIDVTYYILVDGAKVFIFENESFLITEISINWNGYISIKARKDPATRTGLYITDHLIEIITDQNSDGLTT